MLEDLLRDHSRIDAIVEQLRTLVLETDVPTGMDFPIARWALTRELIRRMALERRWLYERRPPAADVPTDLLNGAESVERLYRAHIARWTAHEIDTRWQDYRLDLRIVLDAVEKRMRFEEQTIFRQ